MKKLSKIDVGILICFLLQGILYIPMRIAETITGGEILWLRIPWSALFWFAVAPAASMYFVNVIDQIIEYSKERKKSKEE